MSQASSSCLVYNNQWSHKLQ